jgi:hypothetical protein
MEAKPMRIKDSSVSIHGLRPEMLFALQVANGVYQQYGRELVITSGAEPGTHHSSQSLHYSGCAVDLRTRELTVSGHIICDQIAQRLGVDFDVIYESPGSPGEHIHLEYQPKRRD